MIAAVIPAHNEEDHIGQCLESLRTASCCAELNEEEVLIIVVLDTCSDRTGSIALSYGAHLLQVNGRNVGMARAVGAEFALQCGARWLSFTDADTVVAPNWFSTQLALSSDVVCGTVGVHEWDNYGTGLQERFFKEYVDADNHRHIHGANLGVCSQAYRCAGGFQSLESSEDVALVNALMAGGASISWSAAPRVYTSARKTFRAPGGFGATLQRLDAEECRQSGTSIA